MSIAVAVGYYLADVLVDYVFFYEQSLLESAVTGLSPHRAYMRLSAAVCFLACGLMVNRLLCRRDRREAELAALGRMRDQVWQMASPDDVVHIVETFGDGLASLEFPVHGYAINLVACEEPPRVV